MTMPTSVAVLPSLVVVVVVIVVVGLLAGLVTATDPGTTASSQKRARWLKDRMTIAPGVPDEQKLLTKLLENYHMYSRPVFNASEKVVIKFGLTLVQISDMDEVNQVLTINVWLEQEWQDERLTWDPQDFNGLSILRIPCEKLWLPDIVLYNSADDFTTGYMKSKAMVTSTGNVFWPPPAKFRSSCKIDITYFPFDDQVCELKFGSWTYDGFQVDITNRSAKVDLTNYVFSGEWELIDVKVRRTEMYYACCKEPYPDVRFTIIIRRKTLYYLFNIIFPCLWLTILSLLGFWLPPDSGEKITLGITVLLAFSVFMLLIAESMPATSEFVPLIGIYLTVTMAMTSLSIILTVFVLQLHHVGPHQKRVPRWMWTLVIDILSPVVCLCHVQQRYRYLTSRLNKTDRALEQCQHIAAPGKRQESVVINTLGGGDSVASSLTSGTSIGRGRGNCNGIIVSGTRASGIARGGQGGFLNRDGGGYAGLREGSRKDRPRSEGAVSSRGSGSYVSSVASSVQSALLTSHNEDGRGAQVANGTERSSRRALARKDPRWRPAEYVNCRASSLSSVESPQRAQPAANDSAVHRHDVTEGEAHTESAVPLTKVSPACCLPSSDDVTHAKLRYHLQEGVCETSLSSKDVPLTPTDLSPEKPLLHRPTAGVVAGTPARPHGEAPPAYHSAQVQHSSTPEAVVRDYYVVSGASGREARPGEQTSSRAGGGNCQKERINQHLEVLVSRDDEDDYHQDVVTEWRVVAHVMDRLLFWLFLLVAIVSSVIILIIKPLTKPEKWRNEE